ncbi:putative disease resistance protein RGA3 [Hordeum vulgare]|nr:putative disease resistance protein RGA3 [Hordeum vulgare]
MVLKREQFVRNMAQRIGEAGVTEYYQVKFEKLPVFCYMCGLLGHWHEECGSGEHESKDMEWGPFILAARRNTNPNRNAGRGFGRAPERDADMAAHKDPDINFGRGRGAGRTSGRGRGYDHQNYDSRVALTSLGQLQDIRAEDAGDQNQFMQKSWRFNATNALHANDTEMGYDAGDIQHGLKEDAPSLGKRIAEDSCTLQDDDVQEGTIVTMGAVVPWLSLSTELVSSKALIYPAPQMVVVLLRKVQIERSLNVMM